MTQSAETELASIVKKGSGWFLTVGILLLITGALAVAAPLAAGLSIAIIVGILLMVSGIGQLFYAFKAGSAGAGILVFVVGGLKALVGILMVTQPVLGLASITLLLAAYFLFEGVFEIIWSFQLRPTAGWGWTLAAGIASLFLGMMIWAEFPLSGVWAVGLLVGIKLLFSGSSLIAVGSGLRRAATSSETSTTTPG